MVGRADIVNDATSTARRGNVPIAKTNKEIVLRHLQQKYSFNKNQIAAVMASVQHESNFQLDAKGDAGTAFGLFQWRFDRDTGRKQFIAARSGQDRVTAEVDYAMHEMGILRDDGSNRTGPKFGSEKKAGNSLRNARSVADAINAMKQFERYNDSRGETGRRLKTAQNYFGSIGDFIKGNAFASAASTSKSRFDSGLDGGFNGGFDRIAGDSIGVGTGRFGAETLGSNTINTAVQSKTINDTAAQIADVRKGERAVVFAGTNDTANGFSEDQIRQDTRSLLQTADRRGAELTWVLPGHTAGKRANLDPALKRTGDVITETVDGYNNERRGDPSYKPTRTVNVRDQGIALEKDGLHPTAAGYKQIANLVNESRVNEGGKTPAPSRLASRDIASRDTAPKTTPPRFSSVENTGWQINNPPKFSGQTTTIAPEETPPPPRRQPQATASG
jgi:lysophospholipase L1-like esterase